jgi:GntR family transcriptional regulator
VTALIKYRSNKAARSHSSLPLYLQAQDRLRDEIASGRLKEGDLLPSEKELARKYGVSQGTIRKAILNLTQQGIFYRKQGKGTFVVFEKSNPSRYRNFRFVEDLNSELVNVNLAFLDIRVVPASEEVARYLHLRKGTRVICLERKGKVADQFLLHTLSYLPKNLYRGLEKFTAEEFFRNTLWKLQEIYFGTRVEKREEYISAVVADPAIAKKLGTEPGSPILRLEVKLTSFNGDVVEYRVSHCSLGPLKFYVGYQRF